MATHSSILAWKIPWTEEPGRLHSPWVGCKELDTTERLHFLLLRSTGSRACGLSDGSSQVLEHRLNGWSTGSMVGAQAQWLEYRLLGSTTCGIFPDQGSNPCSLHWQADSLLLSYQRSPLALLEDGVLAKPGSTHPRECKRSCYWKHSLDYKLWEEAGSFPEFSSSTSRKWWNCHFFQAHQPII